jgi:hypothetical protein
MKTTEDLLQIIRDLAAQIQEIRDARGNADVASEEILVRRLLAFENLEAMEREAIVYVVRQKMARVRVSASSV